MPDVIVNINRVIHFSANERVNYATKFVINVIRTVQLELAIAAVLLEVGNFIVVFEIVNYLSSL